MKREFVYLSLHPKWIALRPTLDVNTPLQISYEGSSWHGSVVYTCGEQGGQWEMTFNFKADEAMLKTLVFKQLEGTTSFLHIDEENRGYNSMLIPSFDHLFIPPNEWG